MLLQLSVFYHNHEENEASYAGFHAKGQCVSQLPACMQQLYTIFEALLPPLFPSVSFPFLLPFSLSGLFSLPSQMYGAAVVFYEQVTEHSGLPEMRKALNVSEKVEGEKESLQFHSLRPTHTCSLSTPLHSPSTLLHPPPLTSIPPLHPSTPSTLLPNALLTGCAAHEQVYLPPIPLAVLLLLQILPLCPLPPLHLLQPTPPH